MTDRIAAPNMRSCTLADMLLQIPTGAETIIRELDESVKDARLAFRGLRDYIDQNVSELRLKLRPGDEQKWAEGKMPKQGRWPNCTSLIIRRVFVAGVGDDDDAALATLPLLVLGSDTRRRITHLHFVDWEDAAVSESALVNFALLLPNLQELGLYKAYGMSFQPHAQQLLYEGLATLPHLRSLGLPSCRALPHVGALAGSLTSLCLCDVCGCPGDEDANLMLDASGVAAIAQLRLLRELELDCWKDWASAAEQGLLPLLLDSLPPALEKLSLTTAGSPGFEATLQSGRIRELTLPNLYRAKPVSSLARALLSSRAVGPQLQSMVIESINCAREWLKDPDLQPLWELMRRCGRVEVQEISFSKEVAVPVSVAAAVAEAEDAVRRLGRPQQLSYWSCGGIIRIWLKLPAHAGRSTAADMLGAPDTVGAPLQLADAVSVLHAGSSKLGGGGCSGGCTGSGGSSGGRQQPISPPLPLPSAAEAGEAVLQRMISDAPAGALVRLIAVGAGAAVEGPTAGAEEHVAAASTSGTARRLVLLRGPLVASLLPAPDALTSWVRWLDARAAARLADAGADQGGGGDGGQNRWCIEGYQVLPTVLEHPGVLLRCGGSKATGAAAAAAVAAAAWEVGAAKGAAGALQVMQMAWEVMSWADHRRRWFHQALMQEVEALWEHLVPRCGGDLQAELGLMRQLLELWEELVEMPEEVLL